MPTSNFASERNFFRVLENPLISRNAATDTRRWVFCSALKTWALSEESSALLFMDGMASRTWRGLNARRTGFTLSSVNALGITHKSPLTLCNSGSRFFVGTVGLDFLESVMRFLPWAALGFYVSYFELTFDKNTSFFYYFYCFLLLLLMCLANKLI